MSTNESLNLSLSGQTYLVTGGGSGIGKGVAEAIVHAGGHVVIIGRTAAKLAAAAADIAGEAYPDMVRYIAADVTDEQQVCDVVEEATAWSGRLYGVVHSAGGNETLAPLTHMDSEAWLRTIDLNINGTMYALKHSAREMVRGGGGSFVAISSIASSNTHRWFGAYGVSKAAVDHLVQMAADELGPSSVRVNSIRPGLTRTELLGPVFAMEPVREDYRINTPLPRFGEVEDIGSLAVFLLSDAAKWITGQLINVDGGMMLRRGPDFSSLIAQMYGHDALRGIVS